MASIIFNGKLVEAESRILKQSSEQRDRQFSEPLRRLKIPLKACYSLKRNF